MSQNVAKVGRRLLVSVVSGAVVVLGIAVPPQPAGAAVAAAQPTDPASLRVGVLALVASISAIGQTPQLSTDLPFTTTSPAELLDLDASLAAGVGPALQGADLEKGLDLIPGITLVDDGDPDTIAFTYDRTVSQPLPLVHDDGDLRLGRNAGAGTATVSLTTRADSPFVVAVDKTQTDPLLRVALVGQPLMDLSIDVDAPSLKPFSARQGFTAVRVTGGSYRAHRDQVVAMRDPDGRGLLTLEDLRYSTLPDLFRFTTTPSTNTLDVRLGLALPDSLEGGTDAERSGTLTLGGTTYGLPDQPVWPVAADATRAYGARLAEATGLSMADGLTSLAQYTGSVLALQDAADVPFPNLDGGTSDLFAPGDDLLALLATAASAQVVCGAAPSDPPSGVPAPGDAVYCQATTADGLGAVSGVSWSTKGQDQGQVAGSSGGDTVGTDPTGVVKITGSDGEPDVQVSFTAGGEPLTARSMPRTVQDVLRRIKEIGGTAGATLSDGRLDVAVALTQASRTVSLPVGNAGTVGALVGITGLRAADPDKAKAKATATGASFDVGFGIQTGEPAAGEERQTVLLPVDASLLQVSDLSAGAPDGLDGLEARIGFLSVDADVTDLGLGHTTGAPAVELDRVPQAGDTARTPLPINDLFGEDGALEPDQVALSSSVTASIGLTATEQPISAGTWATGKQGGSTGSVSVRWNARGVPTVDERDGYPALRVFDPVPARFMTGTARVSAGGAGGTDSARLDVSLPPGATLYSYLNVTPPTGGGTVGVARRLLADGVACQDVTLVDADTLTCDGLAPNGTNVLVDGQQVDVIVLGDPFALRDSIIEGLSSTLAEVDRIDSDGIPGATPALDQYTSTLPLVGLTPAQLAVEREALRAGLGRIAEAATKDETGSSASSVSTAQELSRSVATLVTTGTGGYRPTLAFTLGTSLGVRLAARAPVGTTLTAPLRLDDTPVGRPGRGQVSSGRNAAGKQATVPVGVTSTTTLAIDVDRSTARPVVDGATGTASTASLRLGGADLAGHPLEAGVGALAVQQADSSATLGVDVSTTYVPGAAGGVFTTTRTNTAGAADGATAALTVATDPTTGAATDAISYRADATDSSGGAGATQPAPDPMQVKFLAEGLDGLAAAIESAQDGAATRNTQGGSPIAVPLVGTDLDAGAGVPDLLGTLTSNLRTQLVQKKVTDAATAADLAAALPGAVSDAITATTGLTKVAAADVTATVRCSTADPTCTTQDDSTTWDTVSVDVALSGSRPKGTVPFETGLEGLELRSDKPIDTSTSWTLPVTLELTRGAGPQVVIDQGDALRTEVQASLPAGGIKAIAGYLPVQLTAQGADGTVGTAISITPQAGTYDLFDLYDGRLTAKPSFTDLAGSTEDGLDLAFSTLATDKGVFDLTGSIAIPWTAAGTTQADRGFGAVTYDGVRLDVGDVVAGIAKPFAVMDPYLAPVRDAVDVLRTPIPVVSDLSELGGGGEVSLLSLLDTLGKATKKPQLELAYRVIDLVGKTTTMVQAVSKLAPGKVPLSDLADAGAALTLQPSEVSLHSSCTQTVTTTTTTPGTTPTAPPTRTVVKKAPEACPDDEDLAAQKKAKGAAGQTTNENRRGKRTVQENIAQETRTRTGSLPGFSLPFLTDPEQLMDQLTGEGDVSYFRLDLGTLAAQVAYRQDFGPIMAGPVPIKPFVGGSITIEGRLALGFDSHAQTLAAQAVGAGHVDDLLALYDGGSLDVLGDGFYLDDLDSSGLDVPEVKLVTTLEAGAGVSIGIVTAGLKGSVTLTVNLDVNDPNDDGRLRTAEIAQSFGGNPGCAFEASASIEAAISIFVQIELLFTSLDYEFSLLKLGPYQLFDYTCADAEPTLVVPNPGKGLLLTSGDAHGSRIAGAPDVADDYEVRQFARPGGAIRYEVTGFGRVQDVVATPSGGQWSVQVYKSGIATSTTAQGGAFTTAARPTFEASGGAGKDKIAFLTGEEYSQDATPVLTSTPFSTRVTRLTGGVDDDVLTAGDGDDTGIDGGAGNDQVDTGLGDDVATGGAGDDTIDGGAGRDDLAGGPGNDRVQGGPGADRADGGAGDDSVVGGPGRDVRALLVQPYGKPDSVVTDQVRLGFDSGDVLLGGAGADSVDGGDGSDVVVGGEDTTLSTSSLGTLLTTTGTRTVDVLVQGPAKTPPTFVQRTVGIDTAVVPGDAELDALCVSGATLSGTDSADFVTGGAEKDVVVGGDGPDTLDGGAGPDEICGKAGDDQISGDAAVVATDTTGLADRDVIRGGTDDDSIQAGPGNDVVYGDDATLVRTGGRALDGTLGGASTTGGLDFLDGGVGDDVLAGGPSADLLLGGPGDDATFGEGRDTREVPGATAPPVSQRLLSCNPVTRVVGGKVDIDGDLLAGGPGDTPAASDTGRLAGLDVLDGVVRDASGAFSGLLGGEVSVVDGIVDLDRDGDTSADAGDTGTVPLPSMAADLGASPANADGDCVLAGDGDDELGGGTGSDYLGAGDGTDLADGGDGNDLVLGDDGTDVLVGGPAHDVLVGGMGDDSLLGGDGDDRLRGNEGYDDLVGGSGDGGAADGQDVLLGGRQQDVLVAENGIAVSDTIVTTVGVTSWARDAARSGTALPAVPAAVTAGATSGLRFADSALGCGASTATRWLTTLAADGKAGVPVASPGTPLAYDELYGGEDCDVVLGSPGDDVVRGGEGSDLVEGGPGADLANGDDGDDVVLGGSSTDPTVRTSWTTDRAGTAVPDGADVVRGDGGPDGIDGSDLVVGDNALPIRTTAPAGPGGGGPAYVVQLRDVASTTVPPTATTSGPDQLQGDGGNDRVLGQGGADQISGGTGEDYLEGNDGADQISGGEGSDDIIGGSSAADGRPLGTTGSRLADTLTGPFDTSSAGLLDRGGDVIEAGAGADVVLGDNGRITRPASSVRDVARADDTSPAEVAGADVISGGDDADRLLGQRGDDSIDAGSADDVVEGDEGADALLGGLGSDVVIGGSSLSPDGRGTLDDAVAAARTQTDGGDTIWGDLATPGAASSDLLIGDNATVLGDASNRVVQLADVATTSSAPATATSGDDVISGGEAATGLAPAGDLVLGQGGNDTVITSAGDDRIEGGAGDDQISSGDGSDDVVGGSSAVDGRPLGDTGTRLTGEGDLPSASGPRLLDGADTVDAGLGDDVVLGDNGLLTRPSGAGTARRADGTRLRTVRVYDVATASATMPTAVGGADRITAGDGRDLVLGQLGDDAIAGDAGDDHLEGNAGTDTIGGGTGEDDLIGGGSSTRGELITVSGTDVDDRLLRPVTDATDGSAAGQLDGNDTLDGGDSRDVLLGDNGRITRDGAGEVLAGGASGPHVVRQVAMADETPGAWAGSDRLLGGQGDDDLYGQFDSTLTRRPRQSIGGQSVPGDVLDGGTGDDSLLGDQGVTVPTPAAALGATGRTLRDSSGFIREVVRPAGTLVRVSTLSQATLGGDDVLLGGDGRDSLHAGAGKDVSNAGSGDDTVFAGSGSDALWGGSGHDLLLGGSGNDLLDLKKRARDPLLWTLVAPSEDMDRSRRTLNGRDVLYGGSGADGLQADQGDEGVSRRLQGDRLVDWRGPINHYEVCRSGYGYGKVLNSASSSMTSLLLQLAAANGAVGSAEVAIPGRERLIAYRETRKFVCETR